MLIDQPYPWFFMGAVLAGGIVWLVTWLRKNDISVRWYEWLLGAIGTIVLAFMAQNMWAALAEYESQAFWFYLLILGLPGLLLLLISIQLVRRRQTA